MFPTPHSKETFFCKPVFSFRLIEKNIYILGGHHYLWKGGGQRFMEMKCRNF